MARVAQQNTSREEKWQWIMECHSSPSNHQGNLKGNHQYSHQSNRNQSISLKRNRNCRYKSMTRVSWWSVLQVAAESSTQIVSINMKKCAKRFSKAKGKNSTLKLKESKKNNWNWWRREQPLTKKLSKWKPIKKCRSGKPKAWLWEPSHELKAEEVNKKWHLSKTDRLRSRQPAT